METLIEKYDAVWKYDDPRTTNWLMMPTMVPTMIITALYFIMVYVGPKLMANREPFQIKNIMLFYNIFMVVLNTYICTEFLLSGWLAGYSLGCQPVDYSNSPQALRMANACWFFYFSKFIDLFDTLFFILRKKNNQMSFLHVFHHGIMPISWWFGVKFVAGGFGTFHATLNSFVHVVMYTYYGLASLGPAVQKYLWWKKHLTKLQLTQFTVVTIHSAQLLFMENCSYPKLFVYWIGLYAVMFFALFAKFYIDAYRKKPVGKKDQNSNAVSNGFSHGDVTNALKKD
ncbi:unnamed protein product [Owenia fusiformis]|uniref:Elongation of very long chain fatty acids protein n=1 Tax=Owenia fusiformis TaxID=6347 RepID=A0A8S4N188_OWEFU|nr:unnamed protein product [Owenia fusiformis]